MKQQYEILIFGYDPDNDKLYKYKKIVIFVYDYENEIRKNYQKIKF